jgi:hypothetical protein
MAFTMALPSSTSIDISLNEHVQVGEEAMEQVVNVRKNLLLKHSQDMLLAACWSTLEDIETSSLFSRNLKGGHYIFNKQGETSTPYWIREGKHYA